MNALGRIRADVIHGGTPLALGRAVPRPTWSGDLRRSRAADENVEEDPMTKHTGQRGTGTGSGQRGTGTTTASRESGHTRSADDRRRHEVLASMLRERQAEIRGKLRSLRQALPAELAQVKDAEEQSMEDFVLGMDFALMEMESETLRKIDDAILRLQDGRYGECKACEEPISEARLKALPFASLCRDCQAAEEEETAARNARPSRFFEDGPPADPRERRGGRRAAAPAAAPVAAARTARLRS
jgi:DnaK suppressor protein